jgi:signal transduction histidine kinase
LRAARAAAQAASDAKDQFLAMLAHEMRNPLSAIVNAIGVLDRTGSQEAVPVASRGVLRRQTAHLARLLDDLLDISRISRGQLPLDLRPVDLRAAIAFAAEAQRHRIDAKGQHFTVTLPDAPVMVAGDMARLQQVVANLLDNASKYTPAAGAIWVTVTSSAGEAVLSVRDNGAGIPADQLQAVFELFMQVHPTATGTEGGLGLGLTLVKRLVELHRGTVEARSDGPGAGAELVMRLPIATPGTGGDGGP